MPTTKEDTLPTLLHKLGGAINSSLAIWEEYITTTQQQPTFTAITSGDSEENSAVRSEALEYILVTLSLRLHILITSYCDPKLDSFHLSEGCQDILAQLRSRSGNEDYDGGFEKLLRSTRYADKVRNLGKEIRRTENDRAGELRALKAVHCGLSTVCADGELEVEEVEGLVDAMEALGVSLVDVGEFKVLGE